MAIELRELPREDAGRRAAGRRTDAHDGAAASADGAPLPEDLWVEAGGGAASTAGEAPLRAEARRLVALRDGRPVARTAFGARAGFSGAPGVTGYVGWYAAAAGEDEAGAAVLREAAARLLAQGAPRVVGPLDGSTWHRYRVTLAREREVDDGAPFLSEPRNPPQWADHFAAAGFRPLLEYETRRVTTPAAAPPLVARREALSERGVTIRPFSLDRYEADLHALYDLSVQAFAENAFYLPISLDEFRALYAPLRPLLDPALVRLAEDAAGALVGYVFAFPDALAAPASPRIVLKTLAVSPAVRGLGLGAVLVDDIHATAAARGASVLHALMQVANASRSISERSESELFRRYLLYGLETF